MKVTVESVEYPESNTNTGNKKQNKKQNKKGKGSNVKNSSNKEIKSNEGLGMGKKGKGRKKSTAAKGKTNKRAVVGVPTSKQDKLVDIGYMRQHDFLSSTNSMLTKIFKMTHVPDTFNKYEVESEPHHVSAIMKLILTTTQTNELAYDWSVALWNITQQDDILPPTSTITFTRVFERNDDESIRKRIKNRRRLAILSSGSSDNAARQNISVAHDNELLSAVNTGDSVVSFGAEAIVTSPTEQELEIAVAAVKNYFKENDETRGLSYELDVNKQARPFISYGPNNASGNKGVFMDMTSFDGGQSALFVDSGGDRTLGSEYLGVSVGKLIRSHAAYNLQNSKSLYVGNDASGKTYTLGREINEPSQIYMSKAVSRAYILTGHKVTHFVADSAEAVTQLQGMPIADFRKCTADVSNGLLNMLEAIDDGALETNDERVLYLFPTHINNIITLLSQFRSTNAQSFTDDFANIARDILIDFFVSNKYWAYDARYHLDDIRFLGVQHDQFKKLSNFGQYVSQRKKSNTNSELTNALSELDTIINRNILPTIPALDTQTSPLIDELVASQYRIVDLTGMGVGSGKVANPSMNVMMISYLNLLLPTMSNGDAIVIHGVSRMSSIADVITNIIEGSGLNLDVIYTEKNQNAAVQMLDATAETIEEENEETGLVKKVSRAMALDFAMVDLYNNRIDKLITPLGMDGGWVSTLRENQCSFFISTGTGFDYIYLDNII